MRTRGQASTEYVAILLVVVALLAAGAAVAAPELGSQVVATVRTGICIAGGDVCRGADAATAGLEPCVTSARSSRQETTVDIAVLRLGEHGEWQLALQSDGTALVSRLADAEAGVSAGFGYTFTPLRIDASAGAAVAATYRGGRAWRFPDPRSATAFLDAATRADGMPPRAPPADVTWHVLGGGADGWAGVAVAELASAGLDIAGSSLLGLRTDGARRTLTLDMGVEQPHFAVELPGVPAAGGARRALVAEVTWERGELREVALRSASARDGRLEELTGRLDLREPGNRAVAARVLRSGTAGMRALSARIVSHGVVELTGYSQSERRRGFAVGAGFGASFGLSHHRISSERRLTDAVAWVRGGAPQRRFDCLGV